VIVLKEITGDYCPRRQAVKYPESILIRDSGRDSSGVLFEQFVIAEQFIVVTALDASQAVGRRQMRGLARRIGHILMVCALIKRIMFHARLSGGT
jgi:hypothetical protein